MTDATPTAGAAPLTVVLVHGAFADASNWAGVIPILQAAGVDVLAPANPLRGIDHDASYIASVASQIPGPVLLVAHSYGGAVITNAGTRADNVRGLVYVGAFIIYPALFHEVFCADLPAEQASILAVSQRPLAGVSFGEMTQNPAWKTLPSWAIISPSDFVIGPSGERFMAERAGTTMTEVEASHAMMISQPQAVAEVILNAVDAVA